MPGLALIFPGQGSQYVGMGRDLYEASPAARAVFDEAGRAGHGGTLRLMFEGPAAQLTETVHAQPALYIASLACHAALYEALGDSAVGQPAFLAGHSLGEYTALTVAGAFSFSTGLHLVQERSRAMQEAGEAMPGMMAAVLGLPTEVVAAICEEVAASSGEVAVIANDNAPGQIVIAGSRGGVQAASELARARGARRVVPLAVSIAAHSPLMEPARARFVPVLHRTPISAPSTPVIGNCQAQPLTTVDDVLQELEAQIVSPVRWTATIQRMIERGVSTFVEVGPKDVLTGLGKRIAPAATFVPCGTVAEVQQTVGLLRQQATP